MVKYRYDKQGLLRRLVSTNSAGGATGNDRFGVTVRNDSVDALGRVMLRETVCTGYHTSDAGGTASACPVSSPSRLAQSNQYNRFGMLVQQASGATTEVMKYDAVGNLLFRSGVTGQHFFQIDTGSNRVLADSGAGQTPSQVTHFYYSAGGAQLGKHLTSGFFEYLYYDALGRPTGLRDGMHDVSNRTACIKYDADGQAALTCDDNGAWLSFDGANVAGTFGTRWVFVGGPAVDDPLIGLYRVTATSAKELYWLTDGEGRQLGAGKSDGSLVGIDANDYLTNGGKFAGSAERGSSFGSSRFEATANAPGFSFFRNRLYDQSTGRWTQEDPIGVAGGLNLYQFNGNNPVSNSDPFGLCPEGNTVCPLIEFTTTVLGGIGGFIAGGGTGAAIAGATGGAGLAAIPALAVEGAAGGAVGGLGLGKAITNVMFSQGESKQIGDAITKAAGKKANTSSNRRDVGRFLEEEKAAGRGGTKNKRGDFTFGELVDKVKDFLGGE